MTPPATDAASTPTPSRRSSRVLRLGLQIPNFSYGGSVSELYPAVLAQAQEAEAAGFDAVLLMDHFYQLPHLGALDEPMLEAYTALGGWRRPRGGCAWAPSSRVTHTATLPCSRSR